MIAKLLRIDWGTVGRIFERSSPMTWTRHGWRVWR